MKVTMYPLDKLKPYPGNSKLHPTEQIDALAREIEAVGWTSPIVIDHEDVIVAGHGRAKAGQKLGLEKVPVFRLAADLDPARIRAMRLFDNKIGDTKTDDKLLAAELAELLSLPDFDVTWTGFEADYVAGLLPDDHAWVMAHERSLEEQTAKEDEVPELTEQNPRGVVRGQVWQLGRHRLMCGDSTSIPDAERLMNGVKADLVFTDPPYGVEYQSNRRTKSQKFSVLENDDQFLDIAPVIERSSNGWVFVWTSWKVLLTWIDQFESFGYPTNIVIWHKPGGGIGDLKKTLISDYEVALVWHRGAELCGKRIGSVWTINKDGASTYVHPTQKPVALATEAIDKTTRDGANVLDLFGGSGSTLIACEKTGRTCYMCELDEHYCSVIITRFEQFSGQTAELISSY